MKMAFIETILEHYPVSCRPISAFARSEPRGGLSGSLLQRFESRAGSLVLKRWPSQATALRVQEVNRWVLELSQALDFVAAPMHTSDGGSFVATAEGIWQVEPWKPGRPVLEAPGLAVQRAVLYALQRIHARLALGGRMGPSPGLAHRLARLVELRDGQLDALRAAARTEMDPLVRELSLRWVGVAGACLAPLIARLEAIGQSEFRLQPVIRDNRAEHWLFDQDQLTGLVDFGAMDVDLPEFDLARLFLEWWPADRGNDAAGLALYHDGGEAGRLDQALIGPIERSTAILTGANWMRWHSIDRAPFADRAAAVNGLKRSLLWCGSVSPGSDLT